MRTVLFFRDYRRFTGGHLKMWHYFNHVQAAPEYTPRIWFSARSTMEHGNPWHDARDTIVDHEHPIVPDIVFLAGRDWRMWDEYPAFDPRTPVINLVQHARHGDAEDRRYAYLGRNAIRICVSEEVGQITRATHLAAGPVLTIPLGLDLENFPARQGESWDTDLLIAGLKQPELGVELERRLQHPGRRVALITTQVPRGEFLDRIQRARVTMFLPNQAEGCHMPPLEGMALGTLVVCPDVVGVSYCIEGENAFRPDYTIEGLVVAAESALALAPEPATGMREAARRTAEQRSLQSERAAFLDVLGTFDDLWGPIHAGREPRAQITERARDARRARRGRARPAVVAH